MMGRSIYIWDDYCRLLKPRVYFSYHPFCVEKSIKETCAWIYLFSWFYTFCVFFVCYMMILYGMVNNWFSFISLLSYTQNILNWNGWEDVTEKQIFECLRPFSSRCKYTLLFCMIFTCQVDNSCICIFTAI